MVEKKKRRKKITQFKFSWGCVSWRLMKSKCSSLIQKCESDGGLIAHLDGSRQSKRKIIADAFCQQTNNKQTKQANCASLNGSIHFRKPSLLPASQRNNSFPVMRLPASRFCLYLLFATSSQSEISPDQLAMAITCHEHGDSFVC